MKFIKSIFSFSLIFLFFGCSNSTTKEIKTEFDTTNLKNDSNIHETIILGGGVGGLTAAIDLGLASYKPLLIMGESLGLLTHSTSVHNWPGEVEISGIKLMEKIKNHALKVGAKTKIEKVYKVDFSKWPYTIYTQDVSNENQKYEYQALSCIIAMGSTPNFLNIPGEKQYFGKGVSTCAACDGSLYKNKTVAVVGGGDSAIANALYLSNVAKKVLILVRSEKLKGNYSRKNSLLSMQNIEVLYNTEIKEIKGDGKNIKSISTFNKSTHSQKTFEIDGLFLSIGSKPNSEIFQNQLELDQSGYIKLFNFQETSKKGIFAVGEISDYKFRQATTAAGDGNRAAHQVIEFLENIGYKKQKESTLADKTPLSVAQAEEQIAKEETVTEIHSQEHFEKILKNTKELIVADFFSYTCPPCRQMIPVFKQLSMDFDKKVKFVKIDVKENSALAVKYQIQSIPNFIFFKNGKIIKPIIGSRSYESFKEEIENLIK
ncbi:TPA: hypothetical protein DEO28_00980 [Candidatus Dependentiae bacterium]|nr:MAG: Thioredoxin reductase [candidate division TM6 bacterium GW2011_GWE2_31_21]KKP54166.1 MAG: Thioredoxin reductase [candidate division TM6 bacterium GW2011_GWF2_33_332]HBS47888.1 hypothetical protein [Candidatus Dependentiae bacterium]HBZ73073.1 hypothetical protein [Candidatus Dependentiae bacterium]